MTVTPTKTLVTGVGGTVRSATDTSDQSITLFHGVEVAGVPVGPGAEFPTKDPVAGAALGAPGDTSSTFSVIGLLKLAASYLQSLATGAATAAKQDTSNTLLTTIAVDVTGLATASGQATSATSLATIATNTTAAATAAKQDTGNGSLASIATSAASGATAAKQDTGNGSLATIAGNTAGLATASAQATAAGSLATIASNTAGLATASAQATAAASLATIASNTGSGATAAKQDTGNTSLASILSALAGTLVTTALRGSYADFSIAVTTAGVDICAANAGRVRFKALNQDAITPGGAGTGAVIWGRWGTKAANPATVNGVGSFMISPGGGIDDQGPGVNTSAFNAISESGSPVLYVETY